jgi:hypothetical protein
MHFPEGTTLEGITFTVISDLILRGAISSKAENVPHARFALIEVESDQTNESILDYFRKQGKRSATLGELLQWIEVEKTNILVRSPIIIFDDGHIVSLWKWENDDLCLDILNPAEFAPEVKRWTVEQCRELGYRYLTVSL